MMSAPSWCWIRIEISGENRCIEPSRCDLNVTPSSSTVASRFLPGRDDVVGLHAVDVHRQHLLEPGAEREHLEAAGVGERRARPVHERPETAGLLDDVGSGLQVQVVGVGQHGLRAAAAAIDSGSTDLTVALVPTAMNAGVSMTPCGVLIRPVRPSASGSRVPTVKPNCSGGRGRPGSIHLGIQPSRGVERPTAGSAEPGRQVDVVPVDRTIR